MRRILRWESRDAANLDHPVGMVKAKRKVRIIDAAAATLLPFEGCADDYYVGGPYYGAFGPSSSDHGPFYRGDLAIGGFRYRNHFERHHFYGRSFGFHHFGSHPASVSLHRDHGHHGGIHR
jgi:hypothetical protein